MRYWGLGWVLMDAESSARSAIFGLGSAEVQLARGSEWWRLLGALATRSGFGCE